MFLRSKESRRGVRLATSGGSRPGESAVVALRSRKGATPAQWSDKAATTVRRSREAVAFAPRPVARCVGRRRPGPATARALRRWLRRMPDDGMSTAEYAIGTVAAAAFAAILYTVLTGDSIVSALTSLVQRALTASF